MAGKRSSPNSVQAASYPGSAFLHAIQKDHKEEEVLAALQHRLGSQTGYNMRHLTKASGCLDWSTISPPTGHRGMCMQKETTACVSRAERKIKESVGREARTD